MSSTAKNYTWFDCLIVVSGVSSMLASLVSYIWALVSGGSTPALMLVGSLGWFYVSCLLAKHQVDQRKKNEST